MRKLVTLIICICLGTTAYAQQVVTVKQLQKKADKNIQLVDVRTAKEFNEGHIGKAVNIDFNAPDFVTNIQQINKNKKVYIYCRTGNRSAKAAKKMDSLGFRKIYVLPTGMEGWNKETKQ